MLNGRYTLECECDCSRRMLVLVYPNHPRALLVQPWTVRNDDKLRSLLAATVRVTVTVRSRRGRGIRSLCTEHSAYSLHLSHALTLNIRAAKQLKIWKWIWKFASFLKYTNTNTHRVGCLRSATYRYLNVKYIYLVAIQGSIDFVEEVEGALQVEIHTHLRHTLYSSL